MIYLGNEPVGVSALIKGLSDQDAILNVTVPTGSTVIATKDNIALMPTMWVQAADNTLNCALFVIPSSQFDEQNAWTVTCLSGGLAVTGTVVVDENKQYDLFLGLSNTVLYSSGDENTEVTGGWSRTDYSFTGKGTLNNGSISSNRILVGAAYTNGDAYYGIYGTNNAILLTKINSIEVYCSGISQSYAGYKHEVLLSTSKTVADSTIVAELFFTKSEVPITKSLDVSNLSKNIPYYVVAAAWANGGGPYSSNCYFNTIIGKP